MACLNALYWNLRCSSRNRKLLLGALVVSVVCILFLVTAWPWSSNLLSKGNLEERVFTRVTQPWTTSHFTTASGNPFGPDGGLYNFTVVTAMMDIGRGNWSNTLYRRTYDTYLSHMARVLRLKVNMVLFVDAKARPFVQEKRKGQEAHTKIVQVSLKDLPYYAHRDRIQEIMNSTEYKKDNELAKRKLCEATVPEYDIIQWSKLYFVREAIKTNPFRNEFFIWLDGGYGHGHDVHPKDGIWIPVNLFEYSDKITFIEREPVEKYRKDIARLHKLNINIIAGLFFAGGRSAFEQLFILQEELIAAWLKSGIVDDDQTTYMLMYFKKPDLFHLVPGDWYDVFKVFNL